MCSRGGQGRQVLGRAVLSTAGAVFIALAGHAGGASAQGTGDASSTWSTLAVVPPRPFRTPPSQVQSQSPPKPPASLRPTHSVPAPAADLSGSASGAASRFDPLAMDAVAAQATVPLVEQGVVIKGRLRPLIVIDPGHGGVDPGAVSPSIHGVPVLEKVVVLAVAKLLAATLLATGRYEVVMTRSGDTFVPLDQRGAQSRRLGADLFISIHADSVPANARSQANSRAQDVRGATVYTLSDQASDEQARALADKENAADLTAGLPAVAAVDQDQVRSILVDLMRRETSEFSAAFRGIVTAELAQRIAMAREPQRAAAFRVLKQTEVPAVLIELGYMTNAQDQKLLQSGAWQSQVAGALARSIDSFFANRKIAAGRQ
jgi:N-acetylmuramoyl-L-alanine amidase